MSKELECLDRIDKRNYLTEREHKEFLGVVEKALTEYEAIDNAKPSEALECSLKLYKMAESAGNGNGFNLNEAWKYHKTIKQALLKAQEPKHYIKWEDLEFKEESQWLKVKMGDNLYRIDWLIDGLGANVVSIYKYITNDYLVYCACIKDNSQQFFNDLHLERVE